MEVGAFVGAGLGIQYVDDLINNVLPASLISIKQSLPFNETYIPLIGAVLAMKLSKSKGVQSIATAVIGGCLLNIGQDLSGLIPVPAPAVPAPVTTPTSGLVQSGPGQGDFRGLVQSRAGQGDFRGMRGLVQSRAGQGDFRGSAMIRMPSPGMGADCGPAAYTGGGSVECGQATYIPVQGDCGTQIASTASPVSSAGVC